MVNGKYDVFKIDIQNFEFECQIRNKRNSLLASGNWQQQQRQQTQTKGRYLSFVVDNGMRQLLSETEHIQHIKKMLRVQVCFLL